MASTPPRAKATAGPITVANYTNFGRTLQWANQSHWMQPWRSYLETVPATTLLDAIGINFNVTPSQANFTSQLLANSGFKRARIEVGWNSLDYEDPSRFSDDARPGFLTKLGALRDRGIRPLILLNANHGGPCPVKRDTFELTSAAPIGASEVQLSPDDVEKIVLGRTGITSGGVAARYLFTSVDPDGSAQLARPLTKPLPAGDLKVETLRYEPFRPAMLEDGSPNPRFEPTMQAWLNYVGVVTREAESVLGSEEFDVEVWNEMTFGSAFLNINYYYDPDLEWREGGAPGAILDRTVAYLRDPANGTPNIGIGNGFSNQRPWDSGVSSPLGLTAIDKHPYAGWQSFPAADAAGSHQALNGLGVVDGSFDPQGNWHASFTPTYDAFFPEMFLSAIEAETLIYDLSPVPSVVQGTEHGRFTRPEGGGPLQYWVTEVNLDPTDGPTPGSSMSAQDIRHIETKNVLRYITSFVNKGVTAIDFYAANAGNLSLVDRSFFDALKSSPTTYPGDAPGGQTTDAVRRLTATMAGAEQLASPRSVSLDGLTDYEGNIQFEGNGTAAYPPLYNRDVLAFLPFQVNPNRFVIPVYVMTRNVAEVYGPGTAPSRFDLPPERYGMKIGGLDGTRAIVSATDPLTGINVPVDVVSRSADWIEVEMGVTDSPRLLMIDEQVSKLSTSTVKPAKSVPKRKHSSDVRFRIRGVRALWQRKRVDVLVKAHSPCALQLAARGRLLIGRQAFRMSPGSARRILSAGRASTSVPLTISARAATLARLAFRNGQRVKVGVTVGASCDSGQHNAARRVIALSR